MELVPVSRLNGSFTSSDVYFGFQQTTYRTKRNIVETEAPSKPLIVSTFIVFVSFTIISAYLLISEMNGLITALTENLCHFEFEKFSLLSLGGFIGLSSFSIATGAYLIGKPLNDKGQAIALKIALAGIIIMIAGRIVGGYIVDYVLTSNGYQECQELIHMGPRHRLETWATDVTICEKLKSEVQ